MRIAWSALLLGAAIAAPASTATAQTADGHQIVSPEEVTWGPGPGSIPPGSEAAVLYGDPGTEGIFALRLRLPDGYVIPPHMHPEPEIVTVISGTFRLGMGEEADRDSARPLSAGSFFALEPGMPHYAFADEDTVIQLNSTGPWALTYVNPEDDPRRPTQ